MPPCPGTLLTRGRVIDYTFADGRTWTAASPAAAPDGMDDAIARFLATEDVSQAQCNAWHYVGLHRLVRDPPLFPRAPAARRRPRDQSAIWENLLYSQLGSYERIPNTNWY